MLLQRLDARAERLAFGQRVGELGAALGDARGARRVGAQGAGGGKFAGGGVEPAGGIGSGKLGAMAFALDGGEGVGGSLLGGFGLIDGQWRGVVSRWRGACGGHLVTPIARPIAAGVGQRAGEFVGARLQGGVLGAERIDTLRGEGLQGGLGGGQLLLQTAVFELARLGCGQVGQAEAGKQGAPAVGELVAAGVQGGEVAAAAGGDLQAAEARQLKAGRRRQADLAAAAERGFAETERAIGLQHPRQAGGGGVALDVHFGELAFQRAQGLQLGCGNGAGSRRALHGEERLARACGLGELAGAGLRARRGGRGIACELGARMLLTGLPQGGASGVEFARGAFLARLPLGQRGGGGVPRGERFGLRGGARGQGLILARPGLELAAQQCGTAFGGLGALAFGGQAVLLRLDGLQALGGLVLAATAIHPGLFELVRGVRATQAGEGVDTLAVVGDGGVESAKGRGQCGLALQRFLVGTTRAAAGLGEQLAALRLHAGQQVVAAARGDFAERGFECAAQVVGGMADGLTQFLRSPLLDPQQAGNAPVLGLAGALAGVLEAEQFSEAVLGLGTVQALRADAQLAALARQEALHQAAGLATEFEVQFHGRCGGRIAPGAQVVHRAGAVAFEEGGADGGDEGALAGFIGAAEQVQSGGEIADLERRPELAQLFDAQAGEFHCPPPALPGWPTPRLLSSRPASSARASRAASARARSAPCCAACSSPMTSLM